MAVKTLIALLALAGLVSAGYVSAQEPKGSQSTDTPVIHKNAITIKQKNRPNTAKTKSGHKEPSGKTTGKDDWQGGASGGSKGGTGKIAKDGWQSGASGGAKGGKGNGGGSGKTAKDGWQSGASGGSKGGGKTSGNDAWQGGGTGSSQGGNGKTSNDSWYTGTTGHEKTTHKSAVKSPTWVERGKTVNLQPVAPKSNQPQ